MKLSELKTGQTGTIIKVLGHGGFRKRIIEMGFISGKTVEVLLNAPLHDPVKYRIMGYEVSLRHNEAELIEVVPTPDNQQTNTKNTNQDTESSTPNIPHSTYNPPIEAEENDVCALSSSANEAERKMHQQLHTINVALVGNPNCGKTSLFNFASGAHERVGNYSGVTVDAKYGYTDMLGYHFELVDLPGTYSLSAYSPEELYVRKQIVEKTPDIVINVIDASNLERNLYLTTQLIDMNVPMVCALNMYDEVENRGDHIDYIKLGTLLGVPMVPTVFKSGRGVEELFRTVIQNYEGQKSDGPLYRHIHINHGHEIENGIVEIQNHLKQEYDIAQKYSTRYLAIKLLENDKEAEQIVSAFPDATEIMKHRDETAQRVKEETGEDSETAIMDAKYGFIHGALQETNYTTGNGKDAYATTRTIDKILTNRYLGFPLFFLILFVMFTATFTIGQYPMDWIDAGVAWISDILNNNLPDGPVKAMLVDGAIAGVGAVIVFLPQILILYFFISYMEDCGYMARAAFIMDRLMHKMGLHGKSFIPLIMGFGCNVPAVMATRTIESKRSRLVTMLVLPMMSCSARLPIYIMMTGSFFAAQYRSSVMLLLYIIGIAMAVLLARLFSKTLVKGEDTPFVMELPPYRFPTWKAIGRHTWEKGRQYLKKMGGIILVASIIVWALSYFPVPDNPNIDKQARQEQSYMGQVGKAIEPVFRPMGFNWRLDVGLLAGVGAKEIVASTMGVLYTNNDSFGNDNEYNNDSHKYEALRHQMTADVAEQHHISYTQAEPLAQLTAFCFLLFVLLYFPCVATIAAIKGETGSWKWGIFAAVYTTVLAWIVSAIVFQIGSFFL